MIEDERKKADVTAASHVEKPQLSPAEVEDIFRQHNAMVLRAAYRVTGSPNDAEDVLQTVFLRLIRRAEGAELVGNLEGYLRRAAVNAAVDLMRSRYSAGSVPLDELEAVLPDNPAHAPDRALAAGEIRDWLRQAVGRLSPRTAEMFALRFFEGKDNAEIAAGLGTTPATVAVTLHRARERMQQAFRSEMGG